MSALKNKVIITAALTGAITPRGYNIPETPEEIAQDAYRCWKAGAAIVHLHMRDENGFGTMDINRFRETIHLIRSYEDCDVVINCTSSGDAKACKGDPEGNAVRMLHMKELDGIEMGSYDAGSFNWMPLQVFMNDPQFLADLGDVYIQRGIKPEIEIFDAGMIGVTDYYVQNGHLPSPCYFQFVLGVPGGMSATVENLVYLFNHIPKDSVWSAFGVGNAHLPIMYATLALGGHIRVGLEDNVIYGQDEKGEKIPATNLMLVERAKKVIELFGKKAATSSEAREILGIKPLVR